MRAAIFLRARMARPLRALRSALTPRGPGRERTGGSQFLVSLWRERHVAVTTGTSIGLFGKRAGGGTWVSGLDPTIPTGGPTTHGLTRIVHGSRLVIHEEEDVAQGVLRIRGGDGVGDGDEGGVGGVLLRGLRQRRRGRHLCSERGCTREN